METEYDLWVDEELVATHITNAGVTGGVLWAEYGDNEMLWYKEFSIAQAVRMESDD